MIARRDLKPLATKDYVDKKVEPLATKEFVEEKIDELAAATAKGFEANRRDMGEMEDRIMRHFNVVAENIHEDVADVNKDDISLIKDRVTRLEERVGG